MDSIRTLLLARTHTVVLDPDRVAAAATRPTRDVDLEKFEDELAQLGYVMSLDLAMTIRRLPYQATVDLRSWISATLARSLGGHRPSVPLFRGFPSTAPIDPSTTYLRRMLTWLATRPAQPCPWCGQIKQVGALDPCGHLVCPSCWDGGTFAGCPICHRRVAVGDPFIRAATTADLVNHHSGELRLLHLGFDLLGAARSRFERLVGRASPLSPDDRAEVEIVIDAMGPKTVQWLPERIPVPDTMAIVLARLWTVAADRSAMVHATRAHLTTATDVLRVAAVLLGGNPGLALPMRLGSIGRSMRRAVLEALEGLPIAPAIEDMCRHRGLWKRIGERLHPYEYADRLPAATLAFAAVRQTRLDRATFGDAVRTQARGVATVRIADDRARVRPWASHVEDQLRRGDARAAAEQLAQRPGELLRRLDHLVRVAQVHQPDAVAAVLHAAETAATGGTPASLLGLVSHLARRSEPWPRRVFVPGGEVLKAWGTPDRRAALHGDSIGALVAMLRSELLGRAAARRNFARAVIDRGLMDLGVPVGEHAGSTAKFAWPRSSELALDALAPGNAIRLFVHWEEPAGRSIDLDLSLQLFDAAWRHVATCDASQLVVGERAAVHAGDVTTAPPPLGATELVDLDLARLRGLGARHAMSVVSSDRSVAFDRLPHGFAGVMAVPRPDDPFEPRALAQRFDLHGRAALTVPLAIDLETRRLRWLDVRIPGDNTGVHALRKVGGYRAALAHIGHDLAELAASGARPTLWDLAAIHAVARANIVYVRDRSGAIATYRRRDDEHTLARLARLHAGSDHDGTLDQLPRANAPTWFALLRENIALPAGSSGYVLDPRSRSHASPGSTGSAAGDTSEGVERQSASDLLNELAR